MKEIEELSKKYSENAFLRGFISVIPYVGGGLDILLGDRWNKIYRRRVDNMLEQFSVDLKNLESKINEQFLNSEDFFDISCKILNESIKTRLDDKRKLYSKIIRDAISNSYETIETEEVIDIVTSLNEKDLIFIYKIEEFTIESRTETFSGERLTNFIEDKNFNINEVVRMLYRLSYLGILNYDTRKLTLRKYIEFSKNPLYELIINYLKE